MSNTVTSPWYVPDKRRGDDTKPANAFVDAALWQAAKEIAKEEGRKHKQRISAMTLLANLSTQRGEYYTEVRRQLNQRMKQLKKGQ